MDLSVIVNFATAAQGAMHSDPFGFLVVYPLGLATSALMIWAGMQEGVRQAI